MCEDKTLDEALDEIDRWGEELSEDIKSLSPQEAMEYFRQSKAKYEEKVGKRLDLPFRPAPRATKA
jgi:hypothetical protein